MNPYEPSPVYPPDEPREDSDQDSPNASLEDAKSSRLVASWWFLPILLAGTFSLPVLVFGLRDRNLNPSAYDSNLFSAAVNFGVGIFAGLVLVVYYHIRTRMSEKAASKIVVHKVPSSSETK